MYNGRIDFRCEDKTFSRVKQRQKELNVEIRLLLTRTFDRTKRILPREKATKENKKKKR